MEEVHVRSETEDVPVVEDHGFPRYVGGGHYEGILSEAVEEEMLHPRVREEHPYVVQTG